jgi:hypothetical protein
LDQISNLGLQKVSVKNKKNTHFGTKISRNPSQVTSVMKTQQQPKVTTQAGLFRIWEAGTEGLKLT